MEKNSIEKVTTGGTWLDRFRANYNGSSDEAKEIEGFLKKNYKNDSYLPWAVMERLTYMCDPDATFQILLTSDGGLVHTDSRELHQFNKQNDAVISETNSMMLSHTVRVACIFMGKEFVEVYPVQDSDYTAAKVYNQNLVNRALQRAKAKVASRATGLGLKLYEGADLQFDSPAEDTKPKLPVDKKVSTKVEVAPVVETTVKPIKPLEDLKDKEVVVTPESVVEYKEITKEDLMGAVELPVASNDSVDDLITIIKSTDKDKMLNVLQRVNVSVLKKYNFALNIDDEASVLRDKLIQFPNPDKFKQSIITMLG